MTAPTITVDAMRDKLYTLDMARNRLATTEPLGVYPFEVGTDVSFQVDEGWNDKIDELKLTDPVTATVRVGSSSVGTEFQLTKESLLEAASITGLTKAYVSRSPARLTQDALNYWYRAGMAGKDYQILTTGDTAAALTKSTVTPFSNLRLLENILEGVERKYGVGEVLVDYKFSHSLRGTSMRLIVPESRRNIVDTGTADDTWSTGIEINNSLTADRQTELDGYLFRWWCTNGSTTLHNSGKWSRKSNGQGEEVYEWAQRQVDEILGGLESQLDDVQASVYMDLDNDFNAMTQDVFKRYKIPLAQQTLIMERLLDSSERTMYALMQAITATANDANLESRHVDRLLRVGGDLPHVSSNRCDLGQMHIVD